ncbi:MAG TPA: hypothetical protein PLF16_01745 [Candidatus Staskawiczbacteria bacterium]|nr:hypothetical protein [Candidatus Staskawiczbacteria bacterium]
MELIERLDADHRLDKFLRHTRTQNMGHEDNLFRIRRLAAELSTPPDRIVTPDQIFSYVWLQCYIRELIETFEDVQEPAVIAQQFGIDFDAFQDYLGRRETALANDPSYNSSLLFLQEESDAAAEEELLQAASRGMTVQEWRDYIEDLQQDANLQG